MGAGDGGGWGKGEGGGDEGLGFASGSAADKVDKTILRLIINLTPSDRMTLKVQGPLKDRQK